VGVGATKVYAADATAEFVSPVRTPIASNVSVEFTVIALVYFGEEVVGVEPLVV
jgi:hypothetical protein